MKLKIMVLLAVIALILAGVAIFLPDKARDSVDATNLAIDAFFQVVEVVEPKRNSAQ